MNPLNKQIYIPEKVYMLYPLFLAASGAIIIGGPTILRHMLGIDLLLRAAYITVRRMM